MSTEAADWRKLNSRQLGRYGEYLAKMMFTQYGFDVYTAEVDDKGIDFVIRKESPSDKPDYYDVQVKSVLNCNLICFPREKFNAKENLLIAVIVFGEGQAPCCFLIPSTHFHTHPSRLLALYERNHPDRNKCFNEFQIRLTHRDILGEYEFSKMVQSL